MIHHHLFRAGVSTSLSLLSSSSSSLISSDVNTKHLLYSAPFVYSFQDSAVDSFPVISVTVVIHVCPPNDYQVRSRG